MMGSGQSSCNNDGIIPLAIAQIFQHIERAGSETKSNSNSSSGGSSNGGDGSSPLQLTVSFFQLYNDAFFDLLDPSRASASLKLRDDDRCFLFLLLGLIYVRVACL